MAEVTRPNLKCVELKARVHMDFKILERFFSRKNEVYLISLHGQLYVLKRFKDRARADTEWKFLNALFERIGTPRPIRREGNEILMEYVRGKLASELVNAKTLAALAEWLASLHSLNIRKGDCILRNFIVTEGGKVYGLDWEEAGMGGRLEGDLIDVCGSIVWRYHMDVKAGLSLCKAFLDFYACRTGKAIENLRDELVNFFTKRLEYRPELEGRITRIIRELKSDNLPFF